MLMSVKNCSREVLVSSNSSQMALDESVSKNDWQELRSFSSQVNKLCCIYNTCSFGNRKYSEIIHIWTFNSTLNSRLHSLVTFCSYVSKNASNKTTNWNNSKFDDTWTCNYWFLFAVSLEMKKTEFWIKLSKRVWTLFKQYEAPLTIFSHSF
jgi:hypothetical protein